MERKFLEGLGLEKEVIDKIMAEHGKGIAAEKSKTAEAEQAKATLQTTLDEANETIETFKAKDLDVEAAKKTAEDWAAKYKQSEKERAQEAQNNALLRELEKTNTVDADLLKNCLDMSTIISYRFDSGLRH